MSEKLTPDQREKVNKLIDEAAQGDLEGVLFNLVAELAAMTAERDALKEVDAIAKNLEWCMRLSKSVKEGETMVQWVKRMMGETARAELAERQVAVLACRLGDETHQLECPRSKDCNAFKTCADCWAAWARAEAEGGKG